MGWIQRRWHLFGLLFLLAAMLSSPHATARAEDAQAKPAADEALTRRLAALILKAQQQYGAGHAKQALASLLEAKQLAAQHHRPEEGLIQARIIRIRNALAKSQGPVPAPKAEAVPVPAAPATPSAGPARGDAKPGPDAPRGDAKPGPDAPRGVMLSLTESIEIAIQNNLNLRISRLNDRASDLDLRVAWAAFRPTFGLDFDQNGGQTAGRHSNSSTLTGRITQRSPWGGTLSFVTSESASYPSGPGTRSSSYGVTLNQPLWRGAGLDVGLNAVRTARLTKLISRGNLELDVQGLIFNVKSAYANCVRQLQSREVNRNAVASAATFLRLTKARERAGQVTRLDVFNAEVQLADRELALTANQRALENAFDRLKQIMDVDLEEPIEVEVPPVDFGEKPAQGQEKNIETDEKSGTVRLVTRRGGKPQGRPVLMFRATHFDAKTILREALENRIDLLNGRRNLAIQKLNALLQRDGLGQQIDFVGSINRSASGRNFRTSHGFEDHDFSAGLRYSLPWGKITDRAAYERALLDLQRFEIQLKQVRTQVQLDVREILRALHEAEKSTLIQGKKVEQAKRSVEAAQISFERGLKDSFDVIRAEDNLLAAKTDFINRRLDYIVRLAEIERVVGKPSGRVDLGGRLPGGIVDSHLSEILKQHGLPTPAPLPEPRPEDDPFQYRKK